METTEFLNRKQLDANLYPPQSNEVLAGNRTEATGRAKPVIVSADGTLYVCVVPVSCRIDMEILSWLLGANEIHCVSNQEIAKLFPDCSPENFPTPSEMFGLPTILDRRIMASQNILFQSSIDNKVIRIELAEIERTTTIQILDICY